MMAVPCEGKWHRSPNGLVALVLVRLGLKFLASAGEEVQVQEGSWKLAQVSRGARMRGKK